MLLNFVLKYLFNSLTEDQVMATKSSTDAKGRKVYQIKVGETYLPDGESKELGSEFRTILKLQAWQKLSADIRSQATDALVNKSKTVDDMVFSKAMLYTVDVMQKKIEALAKIGL